MRKLIIILLLPLFANGQVNLIPNGSFEQIDSCPSNVSNCGHLEFASGWFDPINCSSDFWHGCAFPSGCHTPTVDGVSPADGVGMAGMVVLSVSGFSPELREYASCKLSIPLLQDSLYAFRMLLRPTGADVVSIGGFGAYFSSDSATDYTLDFQLVGHTLQLQRDPDSIMDDASIWYVWEDTLIAQGGERFMMLGNFLDDANTPYHQPTSNTASGYYIDDVRLTPISKPNAVNELDVGFGVAPNPATDVLRINYKGNLTPTVVRLLTVDGRQALAAPWNGTVDVSRLVDGLYLLQVEFSNGTVGTERMVVAR